MIYFTISGVRKLVWYSVYHGLHCVEVHFIEVSLSSSHREISGITSPPPTSCLELKLSCLTFLERYYPSKMLTFHSQIFFSMTLLAFVYPHPTTPTPRKRKGWEGALLPLSLFWKPGGGGGSELRVGGCSHMAMNLRGGVGMDIF